MDPNERKIWADKGMTEFLFGHYDDFIWSEATHSKVFSKDLTLPVGEESENNRMEKFFVFFPHYGDTA